MEILFQTKKRFWHFSLSEGFRQVDMRSWHEAKGAFNALFDRKALELEEIQKEQAYARELIDARVEIGYRQAPEAAQRWREGTWRQEPDEDPFDPTK